jgi:GntR family transcriptional regulator, rspAB operon transcriptional repressor
MSAILGMSARTVADQVSDRLRSELLAGNYPIGSPLREEELARHFGVSRHPIRRALQKLTLEGLLNARPNCGVVVAASQREHVGGLLTPMRKQLELYALELAFPKLNNSHHDPWQVIMHKMQRAGEDENVQEMLDHDAAFHQQLLITAGLDEMIPVWQGIFARMRDHHQQGIREHADLGVAAHIHSCLLESLFSGDLERARTDWDSHLEDGDFNRRARASWAISLAGNGKEGPTR